MFALLPGFSTNFYIFSTQHILVSCIVCDYQFPCHTPHQQVVHCTLHKGPHLLLTATFRNVLYHMEKRQPLMVSDKATVDETIPHSFIIPILIQSFWWSFYVHDQDRLTGWAIMTFDTKLQIADAGWSGSISAKRWQALSTRLPCFLATKPKILKENQTVILKFTIIEWKTALYAIYSISREKKSTKEFPFKCLLVLQRRTIVRE